MRCPTVFRSMLGGSPGTSRHRSSYYGSTHKAELSGHLDQVRDGIGLHLFHDPASVRLHSNFADPQIAANLLIRPAGDNQGHYLAFPSGQQLVPVPEGLHLHLAAECDAAAFEGLPDSSQEHLIAEWLGQKFLRSGFHGADRHRNIAVASNKNDRHLNPFDGHSLLQVKSVEAWEGNVEDQAARSLDAWTRKELRRRRVGLGLPTLAAKERFKRFTY